MNILPVSSSKRYHDTPTLQTRKSSNTQRRPLRRRAAHQGRPLYSARITSVNASGVESIPQAICGNPYCHCRSIEEIYCASWPRNEENWDPTLVSVIVHPRKNPLEGAPSMSQTLQSIFNRTCPRRRAPHPPPSSENFPHGDTPQDTNLSYGDMFLKSRASRDHTGGRIGETTAPADTRTNLESNAADFIQFRHQSSHDSSHYLIDVTNGSQAPETYVADVSAGKVGIARITPPDSQSPSPPKKAAMLYQNPPIPSYYNAPREKGNQQATPSPEPQHGYCIPSIEINAKSDKEEDVMQYAAPKIARPPLYRNNHQEQRAQSSPKITFRLGKNRTKFPDPANVLDPSRPQAGAPPPAPRPAHITIASLLNDEHGPGGLPSDPPPGFDDFTVEEPSYEYQPMYWGESSKPYVYKRPLVAPLGEEEPEAYHEPPRPVQKVPLELQWQGDDEPEYIPPLFPLSDDQPKKLAKGKGRAPEPLLHEEMRPSGELCEGENDAIDFLDFTFDDDEEEIARGPPTSPRPSSRSLPTLLPKPAFNSIEVDGEDAIPRKAPPSPRPGQISLKKPLSPPLNQEQVDALRHFNLSSPEYSNPSPPDDSDAPDIDTDTESVFELKNPKKLRLKHLVDRGKLMQETIAYHFQTPAGDKHENIYTSLSPWEKEQALLLYDQTDVVPYMEKYSHAQTWDEEEDDAPYIQTACSGTIPASIKDGYKVAHFADEHLFRRSNRTGEFVWRGGKVYFVRDWHPYQSRYSVLHQKMYTAFERKLDEEKLRSEDLKDSEGFRLPPPPRRRLSRARGATPGVEQSLRDWLRTTEFSLTGHDRRMQRQEEVQREAVRVARPEAERTLTEWFSKMEMSFTDADRRREMQERLKRKAVREAAGGPASEDGIGPLRKGPSGFAALLQRGRTVAGRPAPEAPLEEKKIPPSGMSSGGLSDILRRASQRKRSQPPATGDSDSLREASPAPGPRGWKTKEQAREEADRLAAEQGENQSQSPQDIPIPSIEDAEDATEDEDIDDNALRASPYLQDLGSPFTDRAGEWVTAVRNSSEPPPSFDILDVYRRVHGIPARRYSSGDLLAPRNGQRLRALGSRVGRLDAVADVMFLPEWEPRHFQHYVETNKHSKIPKIVYTLAPETEEYNFDADDLDDEDIDDIYEGEYDDEQAAGDEELRFRRTTSEESREDEEGDDPNAWRSSVPASCLRESVEPEERPGELFPKSAEGRHEERPERVTYLPLEMDFSLDVYRFEHGLPERVYGPNLAPGKALGERDFEARPFHVHRPLPSAGLHPHTDAEKMRDIVREQKDAEVPMIVCTMPTPEREVRESVVGNEYEVEGPEDGAWPTASEEGLGEVIDYEPEV